MTSRFDGTYLLVFSDSDPLQPAKTLQVSPHKDLQFQALCLTFCAVPAVPLRNIAFIRYNKMEQCDILVQSRKLLYRDALPDIRYF